jgi:hypothetical protein
MLNRMSVFASRRRGLAVVLSAALLTPVVLISALKLNGSTARDFVSLRLPSAGGVLAFPKLARFDGTLELPTNDASVGTRAVLGAAITTPKDAPPALLRVLNEDRGHGSARVWLRARTNDDVHFLPGDVGFALHLPAGARAHTSTSQYFVIACDRASCHPVRVGPLPTSGGQLVFSTRGTPFHFRFNSLRGHEYIAVIFEQSCRNGHCDG